MWRVVVVGVIVAIVVVHRSTGRAVQMYIAVALVLVVGLPHADVTIVVVLESATLLFTVHRAITTAARTQPISVTEMGNGQSGGIAGGMPGDCRCGSGGSGGG